ncbi:YihY/virulence factor BrkB family protein [uncultured Corynebacterium sp.]|uniref:YihY/virulence factor BrkB family protein n=1 Tax=uncultured Corynebacterium sp. TaxID=159447 RepID=UPI00260CB4FE|nr:YihY/virulence factor BrkB family protein [uncultured Corynebacterium sp.]
MSPAQQIKHTLQAYESADASFAQSAKKLPPVGWKGALYALKRAGIEFFLELGFDAAAKLTYYTVLTFAPALLAIYSIATLMLAGYTDDLNRLTEDFITSYVPAEYADTIRNVISTIIGSATGGLVALTIGIVLALISSSAYTRAFSRTANSIYGVSEGRTLVRYHLLMIAITLLLLIGTVVLLISIIVNDQLVITIVEPIARPLGIESTTRQIIDFSISVWSWVRWPVIILMSMILIGSLYYFTPNVRMRKFRWLSAGSALAIISSLIIGKALQLYLFNFAASNPYGAMGAVIALMTALWSINVVVVFGFKLDAEIERMRQLRAGLPAERYILLPPRAIAAAEGEQKIHQNLENQAAEFRTEEPDSLDTLPAEATDELSSQPTAETDPPTDPFKKID